MLQLKLVGLFFFCSLKRPENSFMHAALYDAIVTVLPLMVHCAQKYKEIDAIYYYSTTVYVNIAC